MLGVIREWQQLADKDMEFLKGGVEFNLVTIAEALAVRQLEGIFAEFQNYGLHIDHIIINQVVEEPDSPFLQTKARMQQGYIQEIEGRYGIDSTRLPLFPYEIKGVERLREVEARLFGDELKARPPQSVR